MSLGSVYESGGKDEIAISCYMNAITEIELEYNHPDQAFPYCGLGSVFYHIDEPAWALRCFLKAREIRELRLGGDTVDTATVYNNLGCCMYLLERNQESKAYYELANAIMDAELGPQHERTLTVSCLLFFTFVLLDVLIVNFSFYRLSATYSKLIALSWILSQSSDNFGKQLCTIHAHLPAKRARKRRVKRRSEESYSLVP